MAVATKARPAKSTKPKSAAVKTVTPKLDVERAVANMRLCGDETRVRIILSLETDDKHVGAICEELSMAQPAISHHLKLLSLGDLLHSSRDGKRRIYSLSPVGKQMAATIRSLGATD